jgi:hypothetical protein
MAGTLLLQPQDEAGKYLEYFSTVTVCHAHLCRTAKHLDGRAAALVHHGRLPHLLIDSTRGLLSSGSLATSSRFATGSQSSN